jgi:hypothetical protein
LTKPGGESETKIPSVHPHRKVKHSPRSGCLVLKKDFTAAGGTLSNIVNTSKPILNTVDLGFTHEARSNTFRVLFHAHT